jgi:hypothetical protein
VLLAADNKGSAVPSSLLAFKLPSTALQHLNLVAARGG